jgi:peroxiredoxin Q/BCP
MSKTSTPRPTGKARKAALQAEQARRRRRELILRVGLVLVVAAAALYGVPRLTGGSSSAGGQITYTTGAPGPGQAAPPVSLPSTTGGTFDLATAGRKGSVLLYFQEGLTCQPCWDQLKVIQQDIAKYRALGVSQIVSITSDPLDQITQKAKDEGLTMPVLSDPNLAVSKTYNANHYGMMDGSRDGHTFVLVGANGQILWRADYGGPPHYTMFVPDKQLLAHITKALGAA